LLVHKAESGREWEGKGRIVVVFKGDSASSTVFTLRLIPEEKQTGFQRMVGYQ
jgi:hypothetical protein